MSTKTIKSNKSKTFALFILQSMFCFFEIRNNLDLRRMNSKKKCTVKLGNKKRFDKEQICTVELVNKELFKLADRMRSMRTNGASKNRDSLPSSVI